MTIIQIYFSFLIVLCMGQVASAQSCFEILKERSVSQGVKLGSNSQHQLVPANPKIKLAAGLLQANDYAGAFKVLGALRSRTSESNREKTVNKYPVNKADMDILLSTLIPHLPNLSIAQVSRVLDFIVQTKVPVESSDFHKLSDAFFNNLESSKTNFATIARVLKSINIMRKGYSFKDLNIVESKLQIEGANGTLTLANLATIVITFGTAVGYRIQPQTLQIVDDLMVSFMKMQNGLEYKQARSIVIVFRTLEHFRHKYSPEILDQWEVLQPLIEDMVHYSDTPNFLTHNYGIISQSSRLKGVVDESGVEGVIPFIENLNNMGMDLGPTGLSSREFYGDRY